MFVSHVSHRRKNGTPNTPRKTPKTKSSPDAYKLTEANDNTLPFHSSVFDRITPAAVRKAALRTNGIHGPSGLDTDEWRRLLTNFDQSSGNLCRTIAEFARKLATVSVTSEPLQRLSHDSFGQAAGSPTHWCR